MRSLRIALGLLGGLVLAATLAIAVASPVLAPSDPSGLGGRNPSPAPLSGLPLPTLATATPTTIPPDVDGDRAYAHLAFFADPARGGRYTASAGYDAAARYMADRFAEIGLEPHGDGGTFFQRFTMPIVDLAATPVLVRTSPDARTYRHRVDFTERVGGTFGSGSAEGELVFVGAGLKSTDLSVVDVKGKIALVITAGGGDPARDLVAEGALGAIYVSDRIIKFSYLPRFEPAAIPALVVSTASANDLLASSGRRVADLVAAVEAQRRGGGASPAFATGTALRLSVPLTPVREVQASNVVGLLRGSDPDLSKRAVLVGGHLDGVGTDPDGTIFQAANDNASGPSVTIEVARALVARRSELPYSVIFVAFAGEEQGLSGSEAFVTQTASIPGRRESLVGHLNLDVVGCCGTTVSASDESEPMLQRARRAAEQLGIPFTPGGRASSDHVSFARRGVHATLLNWSDIGPIHTTSDTIAAITPERLRAIGRVAALMTLEMAAGR
ncbi:MAG: M28 family peptidase [Chloroflexota bacterium]